MVRTPEEDARASAIKTWRALRLAMVALVVGLATALVYEYLQGDGCTQGSISAYYYTPARGFLVGALVAIGVCLYCLKGNTEPEDVLLNLAGMAAPVVALVPTGPPGTASQCSSSPPGTDVRVPNVDNNVHALIAVGLFAFVALAILAARERTTWLKPSRTAVSGYLIALGIWLEAVGVFVLDRADFRAHGHIVAAVGMFACITVVVALNGWTIWAREKRFFNRYMLIALAMILVIVVCGLLIATTDWDHGVLVLEAVLIALFAAFWFLQSSELWDKGLRPPVSRT